MKLDNEQSKAAVDRFLYEGVADFDEFEHRRKLLYDAVSTILNGTWIQLYEHWEEVTVPGAVAMVLDGEHVMVWRVVLERPGLVQIMYVGPGAES